MIDPKDVGPAHSREPGRPVVTLDEVFERGGEELRQWYDAETARRNAEYDAWVVRPVEVVGGTLTPGQWYDVGVKQGYGKHVRVNFWRNCQYLGRAYRGAFRFRRWGAAAVAEAGQTDQVMPTGFARVEPITPSPKLLGIVEKRAQQEAAWAARIRA